MARVSVIAISVAFGEFWNALAADLDVAIDFVDAADAVGPKPDTVALIVAAGGAERDAIEWLDSHKVPPGLPALVVGTDPGRRTAMQLVAHGATDYFALPDDLEIFRNAVAAAITGGRGRAAAGSTGLADAFAGIVGASPAIRNDLARAARLLPHRNAGALIVGETGTGKELLARAIHAGGPRRGAPFVAVNCSAFPEHLIESELFGHERGSFTDAHAAKPGLFEVADTGTLFLDEVGDLPLCLQAKLLRVLEDKEIRRVGGTKSRTVDVRILAATSRHLPERVREGSYREDLFFRLSSVVLSLPPLRERGDDVILIAQALLQRLAAEHGLPLPTLTPEVCRQLRAHTWPGNVRELKNALERALLLSPPGELSAGELVPPADPQVQHDGPIPFPAPLHKITTAAAHATVKLCGGNRSESARRLLISPRRLRRLLNGGADLGEDLDLVERAALSV
ncbi:MAG TPA: sigma-54 dependent transcriptional regulator [Gemmatimonadales bacterium]|jgi:DNA-binding NtrC family response regulator|nr:sigma-54 dependent transcriptional regulator [Gemmatimonadales bacterium]